MVELTDAQWEAAEERGRIEYETKPRATAARYDRASALLAIDLANGCKFFFPPRLVQGLELATDDQLDRVEILGLGFGLDWEELDVQIRVDGVLAGRFGSTRYMVERFGAHWQDAVTA